MDAGLPCPADLLGPMLCNWPSTPQAYAKHQIVSHLLCKFCNLLSKGIHPQESVAVSQYARGFELLEAS